MAVNPGVAPLDPTTNVGKVRSNVGDTQYVPLDPPVTGQGSYDWFSDLQIEAFLTQASDSVTRATSFAYIQLAATFAAQGRSIKTDDLAIDTKARGSDLFAIAKWWADQADAEDEAEANDFFELVPFDQPCD